MIGPWGGHGGSPKDITEPPKRLESITVKSGVVIDSITFTYIDQTGKKHTAGPWGGSGGSPYKVSSDDIFLIYLPFMQSIEIKEFESLGAKKLL